MSQILVSNQQQNATNKGNEYAQYLLGLDLSNPDAKNLAYAKLVELGGTFDDFYGTNYFNFDDGSHALVDKCFPNQVIARWDVTDHPMSWEEKAYTFEVIK